MPPTPLPRARFRTVAASGLAAVSLLTGTAPTGHAAAPAAAPHATAPPLRSAAECGIALSPPLPVPAPRPDGRGAAMDDMRPHYARSYARHTNLADDVVAYRRWQWTQLYTSLDAQRRATPDDLDVYRLQADAYLVNSAYGEALGQLDQVLRRRPGDLHALAVTTLIRWSLGNRDDAQCRMAALTKQSAAAARDLRRFIRTTDASQYAAYGAAPASTARPDAIAVFGESPHPDGTPTPGLLARLTKAKEMADRFPDAWLVVSGAAVRTEHAEADVMRDWLVRQGVAAGRIITDDRARDTVGNAMGMVAAFQSHDLHHVLAVATAQHLPRAVTTLKALAARYHWPLTTDAAAGGPPTAASAQAGERRYTYVSAARAAGFFERDDFARYAR
ncbi:YdcF family protein [Streptomyces sp. NPDC059063]|uniref:YdcF family protein n=1 Tax=unclassified Streptomyces TaxID=2593676 RepID=UPI0036BF7DFA